MTEQWPYYDAIAHYEDMLTKLKEKEEKVDLDYDMGNDDFEDDMKLIDLKEKIELKPKEECEVKCRACAGAGADYADMYDTRDDDGTDLATKLKLVAGIEVRHFDICILAVNEDISHELSLINVSTLLISEDIFLVKFTSLSVIK